MPQQACNELEAIVDAMTVAFDTLVESVAAILREPIRVELLVVFKDRFDAFTAICDHAQGVVRALVTRIIISGDFDVTVPASVSTKIDKLLLSMHAVIRDVHARVSMAYPFQHEGAASGDNVEYGLQPPVPLAIAVPEAVEAEEAAEEEKIVEEADLHAPAAVAAMAEALEKEKAPKAEDK